MLACGGVHDLDALPASYVYPLGMYLGDGCLRPHPRGVFKLRISLDARYPGIAAECERAMRAVMPKNRIGRVGYGTWQEATIVRVLEELALPVPAARARPQA